MGYDKGKIQKNKKSEQVEAEKPSIPEPELQAPKSIMEPEPEPVAVAAQAPSKDAGLSELELIEAREARLDGEPGVPATAPGEVLPDPVMDWMSELDDRGTLDVQNKDPNFHYRWLKTSDGNRLAKMARWGYQAVEPGKTGEEVRFKDNGEADEAIVNGELRLYRCPQELFDQRNEARNRINQKRLQRGAQRAASTGGVTHFNSELEVEKVNPNGKRRHT